jgi:serine/threonine protein kinase
MTIELAQFQYSAETLIDDRYRAIGLLGEGATGAVVLVEDSSLGNTKLALKLLLPHLVNNESSLSRFRTETRITMSLSHPNIVQTFGMGRHRNSFYYLKMEYCKGVSLRELIAQNENGLETSVAVGILRDVASALHYAHERGVIHRDLKPENILIAENGSARLLDFGLAQSFLPDSRVTGVGSILGTPSYMSPEQLNAEILDRRCDVYSFGILAYELISGKRPFDGKNLLELADAHLHRELEELPHELCPTWLNALILECTRKKRIKRPDSMIEVFAILDTHSDRPASSFINRDLGDTQAGTSVLSWQGWLNDLCRKHLTRSLKRLGIAMFLVVSVSITPRMNRSMRWRYSTAIIWLERQLGTQLDLARVIINVPEELKYPDSYFGPSESLKQKHFFGHNDLHLRLYYRPLLHGGYSPNFVDSKRGITPLHFYIQLARPDTVQELLDEKADPNIIDSFGKRSLDYAVEAKNHDAQIIEKLLRAGADPNLHGDNIPAPLVKAIERRRLKAVENLLKYGKANPNVEDLNGQPALFLAIASGKYEILRLLIHHGADLAVLDKSGKDPLAFSNSLHFLPERKHTEDLLRRSMKTTDRERKSSFER